MANTWLDMTVPVMYGIPTMMPQGFVDAYFIGLVGDRELAALSFAFPVLMIVTSVAIGLGAGTSSVVARAIGADDHRRARRLATDSLLLSFGVTSIVCVIGILTIDPLFTLLGGAGRHAGADRRLHADIVRWRAVRRGRHGGHEQHAGDR
ncbi:MAG: MATE family efflux transporter [Woeseiaceae bacterium]|nr:MATE family efflux transporter [Woeseiaceae bacterium]